MFASTRFSLSSLVISLWPVLVFLFCFCSLVLLFLACFCSLVGLLFGCFCSPVLLLLGCFWSLVLLLLCCFCWIVSTLARLASNLSGWLLPRLTLLLDSCSCSLQVSTNEQHFLLRGEKCLCLLFQSRTSINFSHTWLDCIFKLCSMCHHILQTKVKDISRAETKWSAGRAVVLKPYSSPPSQMIYPPPLQYMPNFNFAPLCLFDPFYFDFPLIFYPQEVCFHLLTGICLINGTV